MITDADVPPTTVTEGEPSRRESWTATDLRNSLLGSRHDLVFLAGHFSANNTLAADYDTTVNSTELASAPDGNFTDALIFSVGCHSGYTIVDDEGVPGVTVGLDWTEAFAKEGATLIAGTGYQYGDTDFTEYSERLYADFARQLRTGTGAVPVGQALLRAKQNYLAGTPTLQGIDQKSIIEATLYGLPMLGVDLPGKIDRSQRSAAGLADAGRHRSRQHARPAGRRPRAQPGADDADQDADQSRGRCGHRDLPDRAGRRLGQPGRAGAAAVRRQRHRARSGAPRRGPAQRQLHRHRRDHPADRGPGDRDAQRAHAVRHPGVLPGQDRQRQLLRRADRWRVHPADAHSGPVPLGRAWIADHHPAALRRASGCGCSTAATSQTYGENVPALAAPPSITDVRSVIEGNTVTFSARVVGNPAAGIQEVFVTYTGEPGSAYHGEWASLDLAQDADDSTLWTATLTLPAGQDADDVRYLVQAVNGVGLVGIDDNQGTYFIPGVIPGLKRILPRRAWRWTAATPTPPTTGSS